MTLIQQELVAELVATKPSLKPLDLAIVVIMNRLKCSQDRAFAVLRALQPAITTISEVPFERTRHTGRVFPQAHWKWAAMKQHGLNSY